jgi:hypothetical protein
MKKRHFFLRTGLAVILLLSLTLWGLLACYPTQITDTQFDVVATDSPSSHLFIGQENILWDTGAGGTIFFQNFATHKMMVVPTVVIDYGGDWSVLPLYFSRSVDFGRFSLHNVFHYLIEQDAVAEVIQERAIGGILGMNVISRANWVIDFPTSSVQVFSRDAPYDERSEPALVLAYGQRKCPKTSLVIEGIGTADVLIDSGAEVDMILPEADIRAINRRCPPVDSSRCRPHGWSSDNSFPEQQYTYHNITINGYRFDSLHIIQGRAGRLLGVGFFRKFDRVYLNTKEKVFRFYSAKK